MKTESISTLKIHKLTQAQYDRELAAGNIDENALYLTPDEAVDSSVLDAHMEDTDKHVTSGEKTNWNAAKTHADSAHAPSNAQANVIESISVNGTKQTITNKAVNITVPTDNKDLANGAGYLVASNIANKADKATTLSGYGITNAYTKTEVDGKIDGAKSDMTQEIASAIDEITPSSIGAATSSHTHSDYASKDHTHNYAANDHTHSYIPTSEKGAKSGVATLDTNGKVPSSQLPSYVDDVIEGYYYNSKFYKESAHTTEIAGETGKIYIDLSAGKTYRWSGSAYAVISETLALGETSSTAYAGDKGKANAAAIAALKTQVGTGTVSEQISSAIANKANKATTLAGYGITDAAEKTHTHDYAPSSHTHSSYANQNAFSNVTVGSTTIAADSTTDTLTLVAGSNVTLTPDATNDKITIAATDTTYTSLKNPYALTIQGNGTTLTNGTYDGSADKTVNITPSSIGAAASGHTHDYAPSNHSHSNYATTTGVTQEIASAIGEITPASIGAAESSHGTHVSYGTSATAIGATASAGSASTVSRSDHTHSLSKAAVTTALGYTPPTSDTTYSAGTGISLSGTTFSNSGVRSIATGTTNGTISVNTNGTSANVAVKGLGSAAYTNTTAYDPAGAAADAYESAQVYTNTKVSAITYSSIGAAASSHTHDDRYFTESEINTKLAGYSTTSHTHSYLPLSGGTITGAVTFNASPITKANAFYNSYDTSSGGAVCLIGTVSGNIQIGSKTSGQSSSNKNVVVASEHILRPASNASQSLGTSDYYWGTAYVNKLYIKNPGTTTNSTTTSETYPMLKYGVDSCAVMRYKASSSSRRYKTDIIEGFTDEKLNPENLYNVKLYQYKYKDDHLEKDDQRVGMDLYGFIVEDLVEHYPSAVDLNTKGEPDDWNKTFLIPAMLKLIQNQKEEIDELRADVNALNVALNK